MGCILGPVGHKIKCLQDLDFDTFVKLSQVFLINLKPNEDFSYSDDPFLPMSPMNALRSGNYSQNVKVRKVKFILFSLNVATSAFMQNLIFAN